MPTYITLLNWTDQGVRAFRDTPKRYEAFRVAMDKLGVKLLDFHWTVGQYDIIYTFEAPDDETATAASLQLSGLGNVRSTTLRAFDREEMDGIIAKAAG
ncbi:MULTISPECIES: GYD domain-containing protein [Streptomyces]|uniref:GYD domain-containing protein n=1 Tax=Streptomyces botrytidirepellens TaxID=2486417 RepID=A0A3M8X3Y0_9ACTN|nr:MULTISPECIES: GYD domain-containing protein [Streptomyces]QLH23653.1 GYD domain-containing protein [Streptomyces sp. Rer75]RNG36149.1 GYD domain-containing protein [Streptomyces botrytidirepellens]